MSLRAPLTFALSALLASTAGAAQTTVVDEGSFRVSVRGSTIGTETFSIRRSGSGANATILAQGRIVLDTGEQIRTAVQLRGPDRRPAAYQIEVTGDDEQNITGRAAGNRIRATIVSSTGEQMREYLIDDAAVVIYDGIVHQHHFIPAADGTVPVIIPRQSRQVTARVRDHGATTIEIAGRQLAARRLSVEIPGLDPRTVWLDDSNRVLRLAIPAQDLTAERTSLP